MMEFNSFNETQITVGVLVSIVILVLLSLSKSGKKRTPPEVGVGLPIIGHLHHPLLRGDEPLHVKFTAMAEKYGPIFNIRLGSIPAVVVSSTELAKELFTTHDNVILHRPKSSASEHLVYSYANISLTPPGPYWKWLRKFTAVEFFSARVLEITKNVLASEIDSSTKYLYDLCRNDAGTARIVDMQQWLLDMGLNVMTRIVVGKESSFSTGTNNYEDDKERIRWKKMMKDLTRLMAMPVLSDFIPIPKWLDIGGSEKQMKQVSVDMDEILDVWLKEHMEKKARNDNEDHVDTQRDFMDAMLSAVDSGDADFGGHGPHIAIKATCMAMIGAGSDTTTLVIIWVLSLLLNNRSKLEKAQQELDTHVGKGRRVDVSDISKLEYLQAIVKETFRIYPPAALLFPREFSEDCTVGGYFIPRGTILIINLYKLQRDPNTYPDPSDFKPERFLTPKLKNIDPRGRPYELFPFGAGRRSCPGINLGMQSVHLILANLLHAFDISTVYGQAVDMTATAGFVTKRASPLEILIAPRLSPDLY